jgi:2-keto-4-pentenoate hydratase/2-oxohepta-3-ene-1,7-dioic acid hydratase in catechol pathway
MIPLAAPSKIVCVGRNYLAHAAELGNVLPDEPLLFFKPPSSLVGPGDPILVPPGVGRVDFEGEIGVVIGRRARAVSESEASTYVDAVLALNDVTARDLQRKDNQWARAKGFDTFCAVGAPVPADVLDLTQLSVVTRVNGEERQRGQARDMAFSIPFLIAYISAIMTLEPGDVLATGTPEGVGPLSVGDTVEVEIPGVSVLSNPVRARGEP